tara:strand:+ start:1002 stop:1328 length:327 start_codon:yes stop_codon:yes gene_type:complete
MKDILQSHSVKQLRAEVSKVAKETNIRGYSKMTKPKLIDLMLEHMNKFSHMTLQPTKTKKKAAVTPKQAPEPEPVVVAPQPVLTEQPKKRGKKISSTARNQNNIRITE